MASRPPRTAKSDSTSKSPPTPQTDKPGQELEAGATIKDASLERREIPSYSDSREARIAERAYWRAERRGFAPGGEIDDWLAAEQEVDTDSQNAGDDDDSNSGRN